MRNRFICPVLLVLVIAGHIFVNLTWQSQNTAPATWDPASYLALSERMYAEYKHGGWQAFYKAFLNFDPNRAPLVPVLYAVSYMVCDNNLSSAYWVDLAGLVVLCLALYGIGRRIAGPWCGLAAAWITMTFPMIFDLSRRFYVEMPLAATVATAVYLCIVSRGLQRFGVAALLGVALGVGLLIKITFPLFIVGPALVVCLAGIFGPGGRRKARLVTIILNLAVALGIASLIAGPWLVHNFSSWTRYLSANVSGYLGQMYSNTITGYILSIAALTFLFLYLLFAAVLVALRLALGGRYPGEKARTPTDIRDRNIALAGVAVWFVLPFTAGLFSLNKDMRLLAPMMPALGLLLAYLYVRVTPSRARAAPAVLLLLMAVPFYGVSFLTPRHLTWQDGGNEQPAIQDANIFQRLVINRVFAPNRNDWKGEEVVSAVEEAISRRFAESGRVAVVMVVTNHPCFHSNWFSYLEWRRIVETGRRRMLVDYGGMPYLSKDVSLEMCGREILRANFILAKDSGSQGPAAWFDEIMYAARNSGLFEEIKCDIELPDGSKVLILHQRGTTRTVPPDELEKISGLRIRFMELLSGWQAAPPAQ